MKWSKNGRRFLTLFGIMHHAAGKNNFQFTIYNFQLLKLVFKPNTLSSAFWRTEHVLKIKTGFLAEIKSSILSAQP